MSQPLCDFELSVLRQMAGIEPAQPWGAAMGAALEYLKGSGYVSVRHAPDDIHYELTDAGRAAVGAAVGL